MSFLTYVYIRVLAFHELKAKPSQFMWYFLVPAAAIAFLSAITVAVVGVGKVDGKSGDHFPVSVGRSAKMPFC